MCQIVITRYQAFEDLNCLMKNAEQMVVIAQQLANQGTAGCYVLECLYVLCSSIDSESFDLLY